ncbi:ABC transporter ATP-binding protein [Desulfovibrio oxyclinae]|uniref:ABC transporter ATP-binding protein n=1 Tax=Desulfovibrio oxyclinae TaxID=63560 RepID=UPI00036F5B6D|nr:ABC transporter ATP-binding protein [Desulfovibrio oxyclinae]
MFFGVEGLTKTYEAAPVLEDVTFGMEKGEMVSIIGPSGAGKTTLLKLVAGLDRPTSGRVIFQNEPSRENPVIMVFQDYVLFPSMTVCENVAFGLRARRLSGDEVRRRVMEVLDYFGLVSKADAYPEHLSGGQRQRVAIARGLVVNPMMLLLDEPFANLDRNLKLQTAEFIRETQRNFGVTTLSVTHDLEEAFVMSDRIGLVMDGRLVQFGEARDVYFNPVHEDAARFLGPLNVLEGEVLTLMGCEGTQRRAVRPESLLLHPREDGAGRVLCADFAGHFTKYLVEVGDTVITVYGTDSALRHGDRVAIEIIE